MDLSFNTTDPPASAVVVTEPDFVRSLLRWRSSIRLVSASGLITEHAAPTGLLPPSNEQRLEAIAAAQTQLADRFGVEVGPPVLRTWGGQSECTVWQHADDSATLLLQQPVQGIFAIRIAEPCTLNVIPKSTTFVVSTRSGRLVWLSMAGRETRHLDVDGTIASISDDVRSVTITRAGVDETVSLRKLQKTAAPGLPDDLLERSPLAGALDRGLGHHAAQDTTGRGRSGSRQWWPIISARNHQLSVNIARSDLDNPAVPPTPGDIPIAGRVFCIGRYDRPGGFNLTCPGPGRWIHERDEDTELRNCPICGRWIDDSPTTGHALDFFPGCCEGVFDPPTALTDRDSWGTCSLCGREHLLTPFGLLTQHPRPMK